MPSSLEDFTRLRLTFQTAAQASANAEPTTTYTLAGGSMTLHCAGASLARCMDRPFAHLRSPAGGHLALTVELWDEMATGVPSPLSETVSDPGPSWTVGEGTLCTSADHRFVWYQRKSSIYWLDRQNQELVGWISGIEKLPFLELGRPFQLLLMVWCHDRNIQFIHAGLVSRQGQGMLFAGASGAGKSTATLACLAAGFKYLGDDYIGLGPLSAKKYSGYSLYNSASLEPAHLARFPMFLPHALPGALPQDKSLLLLSQCLPSQLQSATSIDAILLPRITPGPAARLRPATRAAALLRLAPSSLKIALGPGPTGMDRLGDLVERVPAYWLEMGSDLDQIPRCLESLLARNSIP